MKKLLAAALLLAALLVGLLLPSALMSLLDGPSSRDESTNLQQVNLTVSSGLSLVEKMALLADPESALLNVGVGRYQTAASLSEESWLVLDSLLNYYAAPLLQAATVTQTEQMAILISQGDQAFIFWEVFLEDALGAVLRLYLDDETGLPIAMAYQGSEDSMEDMLVWSEAALGAMVEVSGCYEIVWDTLNEALPMEEPLGPEDAMKFGETPVVEIGIPITDGENSCEVPLQCGQSWFSINGTHIG